MTHHPELEEVAIPLKNAWGDAKARTDALRAEVAQLYEKINETEHRMRELDEQIEDLEKAYKALVRREMKDEY